jgi:hypothetical protein
VTAIATWAVSTQTAIGMAGTARILLVMSSVLMIVHHTLSVEGISGATALATRVASTKSAIGITPIARVVLPRALRTVAEMIIRTYPSTTTVLAMPIASMRSAVGMAPTAVGTAPTSRVVLKLVLQIFA